MNMNKVSPDAVHLRDAKPSAARRCASCSMFRETSQTCTLVQGHILPGEVCDRYSPR